MFTLTDGLMIATLGLLAVGWASPKFRLIKPAVLGFMSMVYLLVPGFLVNFLFKQHWGRARPRDILEFGGSAHFTPPFTIADQCTGSCSFMSGETSAIFTVATLVIVLFLPGMRPRFHLVAFVIICLIAIVGAGLRVAFGGHFLSDVIFAALLSVAATLALYLLSGLHKLDGPFLAMDGPFRLSADVLNNTQAEPAIIANSQ
jgi:lipid A 4'-phosphatase